MAGMSPRIKAKKGRFGADGLPPVLTVLDPLDGATISASHAASASAIDPEGGDISASITWTSDVDGSVGTGGTPNLSVSTTGAHVLTVEIVDGVHTVQEVVNVTVS